MTQATEGLLPYIERITKERKELADLAEMLFGMMVARLGDREAKALWLQSGRLRRGPKGGSRRPTEDLQLYMTWNLLGEEQPQLTRQQRVTALLNLLQKSPKWGALRTRGALWKRLNAVIKAQEAEKRMRRMLLIKALTEEPKAQRRAPVSLFGGDARLGGLLGLGYGLLGQTQEILTKPADDGISAKN